jgi:hypothetical protein
MKRFCAKGLIAFANVTITLIGGWFLSHVIEFWPYNMPDFSGRGYPSRFEGHGT